MNENELFNVHICICKWPKEVNKEVVLAAVQLDGNVLEYASEELRADTEVVLAAIKLNGKALHYASGRLQRSQIFIIEALKQIFFNLKPSLFSIRTSFS